MGHPAGALQAGLQPLRHRRVHHLQPPARYPSGEGVRPDPERAAGPLVRPGHRPPGLFQGRAADLVRALASEVGVRSTTGPRPQLAVHHAAHPGASRPARSGSVFRISGLPGRRARPPGLGPAVHRRRASGTASLLRGHRQAGLRRCGGKQQAQEGLAARALRALAGSGRGGLRVPNGSHRRPGTA